MGLGGEREREKSEAAAAAQPAVEPSTNGDALAEARRRIAEQRKEAEALLLEARALEEKLLSESSAAHEARERSNETSAALNRALAAEQEARERVRQAEERHAQVKLERQQIDAVLTAGRLASEAASAEIAELKERLEHVMQVATDASTLLQSQEQRVVETAAKARTAQGELAEAAARLAQCQAEREAAEQAANAADERARAVA
ncbi:MAG TPA: hypothetical protein VGF86_08975 [Candidatus Tumulicola sp.]|jgi:chromosome segregation ATPase